MMERYFKDRFAALVVRLLAVSSSVLILIMVVGLFLKSKPLLADKALSQVLFSSAWNPMNGKFGLFPFIVSTLEVTAIAMLFAIPICLLSAIFLSEYAPRNVREFVSPVIDLLAGIPPVIYGLWGVIVIVPLVRIVGSWLGKATTGYSLLAGGIILSIMVFPIIISVITEVLRAVPMELRETSLALGATRWETTVHVVLKTALRGIIAAIVLGFSRAFGETMAVLMVVGNVARVPNSLFSPAYPLPALIANNYGEMMSIPLYDSALMLAALFLLVVVGIFNVIAHVALFRLQTGGQHA
ncbi:MAG TPA: phosphate ABC transporter permease subunit PstC [Syntrophobacteraceae bacterium]|nr:phosphate ABC transporter permease subunit PstC [Syntrophobacteraceae bacterium]